jgi:hypothetical protein
VTPATSSSRWLILFACLQAVLYCSVLPLFEGFDEPFHFAYVESLVRRHQFPVTRETPVSQEIEDAMRDTPVSRLLSQALPGAISFEQWTRTSESDRSARLDRLRRIPQSARNVQGSTLSYEAQQAPLAYLLLAPIDAALGPLRLPGRVLVLRLLGALVSAIFIVWGLDLLGRELAISSSFRFAGIAFALQTQMLWASVAHVGNDQLAITLTIWFLLRLVITVKRPSEANCFFLAALLAAGLLAKAYFLAFVPLVAALLVWLVLKRRIAWGPAFASLALAGLVAGPWYLRNVLLYNSISGTQQGAAGIGAGKALAALTHINWIASSAVFARWSLWTGNWSFTAFSHGVLNFELIVLAAAFLSAVALRRPWHAADGWLLAAALLFAASLIYQTGVTWVESHGASTHPEPWYAQGILACFLMFCFGGLERSGRTGRAAAVLLAFIAAWISLLTYAAKLLPYYGGGVTRSNLRALWRWWTAHPSQDLDLVLPVPPALVYVLLVCFAAAVIAVSVRTLRLLRTD